MIQGIVEDVYIGPVKQGKRPYRQISITVNGVRYGTFGGEHDTAPANKGDRVSITATQSPDGKYWNFDLRKGITVLERGAVTVPNTPSKGFDKDSCIARQNALAHATNIVTTLIGKREVGIKEMETSARDAAELIVKIADAYFRPYSLEGTVNSNNSYEEEGPF